LKRSVLIIKGFSEGEDELRTDREVIQLYVDFLSSNASGAFDKDNDIQILEEPDLTEIQALTHLNQNDYLIEVLIGHGANHEEKQVFQLREDLLIQPGQIQFTFKKQLHILETCRNIIDADLDNKRLNRLIPKYKYGGVIEIPMTQAQSIQKFNEELEKSEGGILYLFAASIGERAYDYLFLQYLIDVSVYFHEYYRNSAIGAQAVFQNAKDLVIKDTSGDQNPMISGTTDLPFAITII